ncbi:RNA polymerase sigma-70 factor [Bacteroides fragilis]|uniref:RNA polymerase sigma-70 factor n=1 Tax=Bacteroides fragilis TaxID=817 RepID=A0ABD4VYF4_BACFG|nr:RNA polymerase sigma-70 factor [Bacteroides fragilis]MCZ2656520.1 RNA polymerase sigma-70 factor [Bacteroides fragilis]
MPSNSSDLIRFNKFFSENQQRFIRFAWTYTRDEIVAEDIVMEALMSYWENRLKISSEINPSAYVLTVVKNKCLNHLRHLQLVNEVSDRVSSHSEWELSNRIATLDACEPSALFAGEVQNIIDHVISCLSANTARIFVLSRYENKSHKEIAEIMGMTVKGVEFHISKATKELRVALKDYLVLFPFLYDFLT